MQRAASLALGLLLFTGGAHAQQVQVTRPQYPQAMMDRANHLLQLRDLSGARRMLEAAAAQGVGEAATLLGRTFDPAELTRLGSSVAPDPAQAERWYKRAIELGDPAAQPLLQALPRATP